MKLNELSDTHNFKKYKKRVGRGIGSGTGKTCGRGHKGQNSRSGVSLVGFEGGQMPLYRRLPKRGFNNPFTKKYQLINTGNLSAAIEKGSLDKNKVITAEDLVTCGLTKTKGVGIKILASGELTYKINIEVDKASKSAISMIESKGGKVILASDRSKNMPKTKGNQKEPEEKKASTPDA